MNNEAGTFDFTPWAEWLANTGNHDQGRSSKTVMALVQDMRVLSRWFEIHTDQAFSPASVTSYDLRAFHHHEIVELKREASTWNRRRVSLSLFFGWCVESGLIIDSPFKGIPYQEEVEKPAKWPSKSDYFKFMRRVEQSINSAKTETQRKRALRDQAMIMLMACSGMRVGEVDELASSDLLLSERKGDARIRNGKRGKARTVPVGRESRQALTAWLEATDIQKDDELFTITTRQIQRRVSEIARAAGVQITPHQLRHRMIHEMLANNVPLPVAQDIVGHKNGNTTLRYAKSSDEERSAAVENL